MRLNVDASGYRGMTGVNDDDQEYVVLLLAVSVAFPVVVVTLQP